jgi:hypothetical protein
MDAALAAVALNIGQLVDAQRVAPVEGDVVELPDGGRGLAGGRVLDEGEAASVSMMTDRTTL